MNNTVDNYDIANSFAVLMRTCVLRSRDRFNAAIVSEGYPVSVEQWAFLSFLSNFGGSAPQHVLVDLYGRSKVAATMIIEKLEKNGLVQRRPDPEDRRRKRVHLTDAGEKMQKAIVPLAIANTDHVRKGITDEEMEIFIGIVTKMIANLQE